MKAAIVTLAAIGLTLSLSGCGDNILTNKENSTIGDDFDNDSSPSIDFSFSSPMPNITSDNAASYPVSGTCDPNAGDVTVVISSPDVSQTFSCVAPGEFSGTVDVSTVTSNPPSITASQGTQTTTASPAPINDQEGPSSAPTATAPGTYVGGGSTYNLPISCNEAGEIVEISGVGLDPSPQTYTCTGSGTENFPLLLLVPLETADPNNLTISSEDQYGNPAGATTSVSVPIDTQGPTVAVSNGGNIIQGQTGSFTVTVTDLNFTSPNYTVSTSGAETANYNCTTNPCTITTGTINGAGTLTLSVAANAVSDDIGNTGDSVLRSSSLTVNAAGALGFNNPLPTINTTNATSYPVSGSCDEALGNVTVTVTSPTATQSIPCNAPGQFSGTIDVSGVTSNPPTVSVTQGVNTTNASPQPTNDQTPITNVGDTADQSPANGTSETISAVCIEAGEVLSFSGSGLNSSPQTHTCTAAGSENVTLTFASPVETGDPNTITVNSTDANGNPSTNPDTFNLPIDNVAPTVSVVAGSDVVQGSDASFTVTVTDGSSFTAFTPSTSSGTVSSGSCSASPCSITVSGASPGPLTLTVAIGAVVDAAGNSNAAASSDSLTIGSTNLAISEPLPTMNTTNASAYPVSGSCDPGEGNVTITIGTPNVTESVTCDGGTFTFNGTLDVSGVTSNPPSISVSQGANTDAPSTAPTNDQTPISNVGDVADQSPANGASETISAVCTEAGEVLSFSGSGLNPSPQTHTCTAAGSENVTLTFASPVETGDPNTITVNSTDANGNPSTNPDTFNLPIDNVAPTVAVVAGSDVVQGNDASFTVTVTDGSSFTAFTPSASSGTVSSGSCSASPCSVTVSGAAPGTLTLTVAIGAVVDAAGNSNAAAASDSLNVGATTLAISEPLPTGNTTNNTAYPVSGSCDEGQGDVTITVGTPNATATVSCTGSPGSFSGTVDISSVTSDPMNVSIAQNGNTDTPTTAPTNDQTPITNAPSVADQSYTNGSSVTLAVNCNEAGEVVTFTNSSLNPNPQTHTCTGAGSENVTLNYASGQQTADPNNVVVSSVDANGNPTTNDSSFNLPIDNVAPTVTVVAGSDVVQGDDASFTVTVTDGTSFTSFTPSVSSGTVSSGACSSSPCSVTVSGASAGALTLTVAIGAVVDAAGNSNAAASNDSLNVGATTLAISEPLPTGNTTNNTAYPVSGSCDEGQGDVTITVGTPNATATVACTGSPGSFSGTVDISSVTSDPMNVSIAQNGNTDTPTTAPTNDQTPITNAPSVADQSYTNGTSTTVAVGCNEAGEVVTFNNASLNPNPQTHTCTGSGSENVTLNFASGQQTADPNNVVVSSVDANGNATTNNSSFNLPIDNVAPTVTVVAGSDVVQGDDASFTVTVTDGTSFTSFTPSVSSGTVSSGACSSSPCSVTVSGASAGALTLTVAIGAVVDAAGNSNAAAASDSLNVGATTLSVTSAPTGTSLNASSYPVSGACDAGQGDVTITIGTPNVSATVSCTGSPGSYSANLDISSVTANPMTVSAAQNGNNASFSPDPVNDQNGPASAPTATGPGSVIGGTSHNLPINCNETGEVVSITGNGIDPDPQTYTCTGSGSQNFPLSLEQGVSFPSPNNLTVSSTDQYGNPSGATTTVDVPVDTLAPTVSIANGGDVVEGNNATFTITVTDDNITGLSYAFSVSSGTPSPSTCTANPCAVSVSGAAVGALTLTVAANAVSDDLSNTGPSSNQVSSLTVTDDPEPTITGVSIGSTDGDSDSWYEDSDTVSIAVQFSESVTVNTTGGTPSIPVTLTSGAKTATYASGSGTNTLNFNFAISSGDEQCNGTLALGALASNSGTIQDSIGQDSSNSGLASSVSGAQVDAIAPVLTGPVDVSADDATTNKAVTAAISAKNDNCSGSVINAELAIGEHDGTVCSDIESIVSFQNIGNVLSYQPVSGTAPFDSSSTFDLNYSHRYCSTFRITDSAGNSTQLSSTEWTYGTEIPPTLTGIELWLDGLDINGDLSIPADGSIVTTWADKSGNGNHGTSAGSPTVNSLAFGGLPSIDTSSSGQVFTGPSVTVRSVYVVYQSSLSYTSASTPETILAFNNTVQNSLTFGSVTGYFGGEVVTWLRASPSRDGISNANLPSVDNTSGHIVAIATDADDAFMSSDGSGDIRNLTAGGNENIAGPWRLGDDNASRIYNGHIAEVIVYNTKHSATDIVEVEGYLACKWNLRDQLSITHLYYHATGTDNTGCL